MPNLNQKGAIHLLIPLILIAGIAGTVFLVTQGNPLKLFSRAGGGAIWVTDVNGGTLPVNSSNIPQSKSATVRVELNSPLGAPVASSSESVSGPNKTGTVTYKLAETPAGLGTLGVGGTAYNSHPTIVNYTFKDSAPGTKFLWAEFKDSAGKTERHSTQVEIVSSTGGGGSGFGKAVSLSGTEKTNFQYITIPSKTSLDAASNYTIEAWVKPSAKPFSFGQMILNKASDSSRSYFLKLVVWDPVNFKLSSGKYGYSYQFAVADKNNSNCAYREANQATVETTEQEVTAWQHVAGVVNNGKLSLYVNGKEVTYFPTNGVRTVSSFCSSTNPLQIGSYPTSDPNFPQTMTFNGLVDEIRISNVARYTSNFTPSAVPFNPDTNTIALYHLDGNANDASSNGNNGQVMGSVQFVDSTIGGGGQSSPTPTSSPEPTLKGTDGTWCNLSDTTKSYDIKGTCQDKNGTYADSCDGNTVKNYYCTGTYGGSGWTNVKCESGGYVCSSVGKVCSDGACKVASSPTPTATPKPVSCTTCSADINKDGGVNVTDYSYLVTCFNKKPTDTISGGRSCAPADVNGDGKIDAGDVTCLTSKFGQKCTAPTPGPVVPQADLIIEKVNPTGSRRVGSTNDLEIVVKNVGKASAVATDYSNIKGEFRVSIQTTQPNGTSIGSCMASVPSPLQANQSRSVRLTKCITYKVTGTHKLILEIDSLKQVKESNENNNQFSTTVSVSR